MLLPISLSPIPYPLSPIPYPLSPIPYPLSPIPSTMPSTLPQRLSSINDDNDNLRTIVFALADLEHDSNVSIFICHAR